MLSGNSLTENATKAIHAVWTFPGVVFASFLIAWAAESAQFFVSQALSLAILAWLQTLPEFAVEAVIAWERNVPLITANFTGSLRLLVGVGWPMIYFIAAISARRRQRKARLSGTVEIHSDSHLNRQLFDPIHLEREHAVEVMGLLPPLAYFWIIYFKGTLNMIDSVFLVLMYVGYLLVTSRIPPRDEATAEEVSRVAKKVLTLGVTRRTITIVLLFVLGGVGILFVARPFLHSMLALAVSLGVSQFVFVQWVAPFLSEFPEKVSAFYWARTVKHAPMAFMNMVSSNINQWTLLVAMIPVVYSLSCGGYSTVVFDEHQRMEILLTMAQSILGFLLLANMEFRAYEAGGLFVLWFVQFIRPEIREEITVVYFGWVALELFLTAAGKRKLSAFREFKLLWREHSLGGNLIRK